MALRVVIPVVLRSCRAAAGRRWGEPACTVHRAWLVAAWLGLQSSVVVRVRGSASTISDQRRGGGGLEVRWAGDLAVADSDRSPSSASFQRRNSGRVLLRPWRGTTRCMPSWPNAAATQSHGNANNTEENAEEKLLDVSDTAARFIPDLRHLKHCGAPQRRIGLASTLRRQIRGFDNE